MTGNCTYSGFPHSIHAEDSERLVIGPNSIDHNSDYKGKSNDRILLTNCRNVTMTGLILQHTREADEQPEASVEISGCQKVSLTGCHVLGARRRGVLVRNSSIVRVADCTIRQRDGDTDYRSAVEVDGQSSRVMVANNSWEKAAPAR